MLSLLSAALAALMLLGIYSGAAAPTTDTTTSGTVTTMGDGGPIPSCYPGGTICKQQ